MALNALERKRDWLERKLAKLNKIIESGMAGETSSAEPQEPVDRRSMNVIAEQRFSVGLGLEIAARIVAGCQSRLCQASAHYIHFQILQTQGRVIIEKWVPLSEMLKAKLGGGSFNDNIIIPQTFIDQLNDHLKRFDDNAERVTASCLRNLIVPVFVTLKQSIPVDCTANTVDCQLFLLLITLNADYHERIETDLVLVPQGM